MTRASTPTRHTVPTEPILAAPDTTSLTESSDHGSPLLRAPGAKPFEPGRLDTPESSVAASHETWRNAHQGAGRVRRRSPGDTSDRRRRPVRSIGSIIGATVLLSLLAALTSNFAATQTVVIAGGSVLLAAAIHVIGRSRGMGTLYTVLGALYALILGCILHVLVGTVGGAFALAVALGVTAAALAMNPDVPDKIAARFQQRRWVSHRTMRRRSLPDAIASASVRTPVSAMIIQTKAARRWSLEDRLQRRVLAHTLRDGCRLSRSEAGRVLVCTPATAPQEAAFVARRITTVLNPSEVLSTVTTTNPDQTVAQFLADLESPRARAAAYIAASNTPPSRWVSLSTQMAGSATDAQRFISSAILEKSGIPAPPPSWLGYGIRPRLAAHPVLASAPITDLIALNPYHGAIIAELVGIPIAEGALLKHRL